MVKQFPALLLVTFSVIASIFLYTAFTAKLNTVFSGETCLSIPEVVIDPVQIIVQSTKYCISAKRFLSYFFLLSLLFFNAVLADTALKWKPRKLFALVLALCALLVFFVAPSKPAATELTAISLMTLTIVVHEGKIDKNNAVLLAVSLTLLPVSILFLLCSF